MNKLIYLLIIIFLISPVLLGQEKANEKDSDSKDDIFEKAAGVVDRAGNTHNASNIGLFFENRGKLYPRRLTQGPSGEFPIGTAKHYIYRINPMVGIPGNVIQGRYITNEEWEAVGGYHNLEYAKIAFSDNPKTWHPDLGWPIKDANGNPIIKSDQDSYCVYNDANNTVKYTGITVAQTGYTYGVKFAQNLIFFKFEISNQGQENLDSLYFTMYCDIDIGDASGGAPEYKDDLLEFDKANNFLYFFDDGVTTEWIGGVTGYFGVAMLQTPSIADKELGVTDMHYNLYDDDRDEDDLQYAIISSQPEKVVPQSLVGKYFHTGNSGSIHFDDPATIPSTGLDLTATMSSGPYELAVGDTLVFYTVIVAGNNKDELYEFLRAAQKVLQFNFEIAKPPTTPLLNAYAGDGYVTLFWNDVAELSLDKFSGEYDFEGYRIYKSLDKGVHWDQYDRNIDASVGADPVPLIEFDVINQSGLDTGLQYSFTDSSVTNGFEYWYTITAYDRGSEAVERLESPRGKSTDALNTVSVIPKSKAGDRFPVASDTVQHLGTGKSNYVLQVQPIDQDTLGEREYNVQFSYIQRVLKGTLKTQIIPTISDSSYTVANAYGIEFISPTSFHLIDLSTGDYIGSDPRNYRSGTFYSINRGLKIKLVDPDPAAPPEDLPAAGDYITLSFAVSVVRNDVDTVVTLRPFALEKLQSTSDGVAFSLNPPDIIQSVSRVSGTENMELTFSVADEASVEDNTYLIWVAQRGFDAANNGFVSLLVANSQGDTVTVDSLFTLDSFAFAGIEGRITFPSSSPPAIGTAFVLETVLPIGPTLQDVYRFKLRGAQLAAKAQRISELENIKVVPNPYLVSSLYEPEFGELRREPLRQLQFINLPATCTIYIFTIAGDLVKKIKHQEQHGTAVWDLRADGGREIASGVYLYVVKTDNGQFRNRFAVIK